MSQATGAGVIPQPAPGSAARLLVTATPQAYRRARIVCLAVVGVATVGMLWPGPCYQSAFPNDTSSILDAGWRVYNGQRPHIDFYSQLGPVPLLMVAFGMVPGGPSGAAIFLGYVAVFPLVAVWAWALARPRLPAVQAGCFTALVAFLVIGPRALSAWWRDLSFAMNYNRLGWALFLLLLFPVFLSPRSPTPRRSLWEGVSTGVALAILFFLKVNYLTAGVAALVLGAFLGTTNRQTWAGLAGAFVLVAFAFVAYLRFDFAAIFEDMRSLLAVQDPAARAAGLAILARWNAPWLVLMFLSALFLSLSFRDEVPDRRSWFAAVGGSVAMALLGVAVCAGNMQRVDIPAFAAAMLILCERFRRLAAARTETGEIPPAELFRYLVGSVLALGLVGVILLQDVAGVVRLVSFKFRTDGPEELRIDAAPLRDLVFSTPDHASGTLPITAKAVLLAGGRDLNAHQYAVWVNDGLALLRPHAGPDSRILTLDWTNPFSYALGLPGVHGDRYCWHYGRMVDERNCPPGDRLFREVTLVIVPKRALDPNTLRMMRAVYQSNLDRDFEKIQESDLWELYARRISR